MPVTVRPVEAQDRPGWEHLFVDYGVFYETTFGPAVRDGVWGWLMDKGHDVNAIVAVDDSGDLVGFAHYRRHPDTFTAGPGWVLDDLFVDPAARGSGIAAKLIDAVAERASAGGGGTLRWITAASNENAQRVYDRLATRATWVTYEREIV